MSGKIHNATGRTSLARQGDSAELCVRHGDKCVDGGSTREERRFWFGQAILTSRWMPNVLFSGFPIALTVLVSAPRDN